MMVYAIYPNPEISIVTALLISLVAILIVFMTLGIIIGVTSGFGKATDLIVGATSIQPRRENQILESDEDAVVALLAATIDFHKETGQDCRLVSIERSLD